ncbi:hypothetical protein PR048_031884 [Dryococelus australis]|uniref:Uncharacterized protein n=1 Tax=Dryococelus australis TaxID=614101 RepID=A0ABQ9G6J4_9NEOP|nr:hypothetical protein PR048_031884 [Dryococelus australis]
MLSLTDESKYDDMIAAFNEYCQFKKNTVYERYFFNKIGQSEGRTFDSFLIELKTQATFCAFGKEKDSLIGGRIVFGINDPHIDRINDARFSIDIEEGGRFISKRQTDDIHGIGKPGSSLVVDALSQVWRNKGNPCAAVLKNLGTHGNSGEGSQTLFLYNGRKPSILQKCKFCEFSREYGHWPAYNKRCRKCKGMDNFERVCKKSMAAVNAVSNCSCYASLFIGKQSVTDKIDSGAQTNIISFKTVEPLSPTTKIFPLQALLIYLDSFVTPVIEPQGRVPLKLRHKLKDTLQDLGPTDKVLNLIVVGIPNGELRLCIHPTYLNKTIKRSRINIPKLEDITSELASTAVSVVLDMKHGYWHMELDEQ